MVVVDSGVGNIGSILNMVKKAGGKAIASSDPDVVAGAERLVLPGVGAFDAGMRRLRELRLIDVLNQKALEDRTPILGLCLGVQLFTLESEEGSLPGLGWFNARTVAFRLPPDRRDLKVPHMGWNYLKLQRGHALLGSSDEPQRYYFVHSYHIRAEDVRDVVATSEYGYEFPAVIARDNVFGVQFHPEKSHSFGLALFRRFLEWQPC